MADEPSKQLRYSRSPKGKATRAAHDQRLLEEKRERQALRKQQSADWTKRYQAEHPPAPPAPKAYQRKAPGDLKPKRTPKRPNAPPLRMPWLIRSHPALEPEPEEPRSTYVPEGNLDRAARNREMIEQMRAREGGRQRSGEGPTIHPWWRKLGS